MRIGLVRQGALYGVVCKRAVKNIHVYIIWICCWISREEMDIWEIRGWSGMFFWGTTWEDDVVSVLVFLDWQQGNAVIASLDCHKDLQT